jgi:hypothetical protein
MTGTGYDPRKARGFIDVQALHMYVSERVRHQTRDRLAADVKPA